MLAGEAMGVFRVGQLVVTALDGWELFERRTNPLTLARVGTPDGVLQLSAAHYESGKKPDPSLEQLGKLVLGLAKRLELRAIGSPETRSVGDLRIAAASFVSAEHTMRIWMVSDGWSIATISYTGSTAGNVSELADAERMVDALRFERDPDLSGSRTLH
jgi:hypothetical protein